MNNPRSINGFIERWYPCAVAPRRTHNHLCFCRPIPAVDIVEPPKRRRAAAVVWDEYINLEVAS